MPAKHPTLQSIVPLGAVPERVRALAAPVLEKWGYSWADVTFAGTALLPRGKSWQRISEETWVVAISAGPIEVGDELESPRGRTEGVAGSSFSRGVIPAIPYQTHVFESLGRRGGGPPPEGQPPPESSWTVETARSRART
jgi:hypothetical protein